AQPQSKPVTISNNGNSNLVISHISIEGASSSNFDFSPKNLPVTVPPGSNTTVNVTFAPQSTGPQAATLSITANAIEGASSVSLSGSGLAPQISYGPGNINFGNQAVGVASNATAVTIGNIGGADLVISSVTFSGATASDFQQNAALPITVAPLQSTTLPVIFTPSVPGNRSAT